MVQARFQREAAILEQLGENHQQIPRLYAYFSEDEQFYLVQEWIEGKTLEDISVPQPESAIVSLLTSLLPVLSFIHAQGIVHRDIKPENIILRSGSRQPVLIDFGAVKETMETVMSTPDSSTSSIVIGTPGYMPVEQAVGRPVTASDLYSLGVVAIYLLTGKSPQTLSSDITTGKLHWREHAPHASEAIKSLIDRAIQPYPRDRYSSADAMLAAVSSLQPRTKTLISTKANAALSLSSEKTEQPTQVVSASSLPTHQDKTPSKRWFLKPLPIALGIGTVLLVGANSFYNHQLEQSLQDNLGASANNAELDDPPYSADNPEPLRPLPSEYDIAPNQPVVLRNPNAESLSVYQEPSWRSGAGYRVSNGERGVTTGQTQTDAHSGTLWYRVKLDNGTEGWVPQAFLRAGESS